MRAANALPLSHRHAKKLVNKHFRTGVDPKQWQLLKGHLHTCPSCHTFYEQHQRLENILCHGDATAIDIPTVFQIERLENRLLGRVAPPTSSRADKLWFPALGLVSALMVLFLVTRLPQLESDRTPLAATVALSYVNIDVGDVFQARGGRTTKSLVGIRVFRVGHSDRVEETQDTGPALTLNDIITFSYSSDTGDPAHNRYTHLTLVGKQADGLRWYYPSYGADERQGIGIKSGMVDEVLNDGFRLSVHHSPGALRVYAFFSEEALNKDAVAEALRNTRVPAVAPDISALSDLFEAVEIYSFSTGIVKGAP